MLSLQAFYPVGDEVGGGQAVATGFKSVQYRRN